MKILDLKINHFGKLENKYLKLEPHINLIYGKNESGKSTLLKYIIGMFYGVSKNKNGKDIPDIDKYTPWYSEDFSGKMKYQLDNNETYEIYREFKKKNPKIYNENSEDVSKNFNIDKTKGNMFFYDQTKIEEELFISSLITQQQEVKLDIKTQNTLVQKISNLIGTGEDTVSYQRTIKNLDKRLLQEVGTSRSQDRPINSIKKRIDEIENEKEYLQPYILEKYEIQERKEKNNQECKQIKHEIEFLKELKSLEEKNIIEKEKIEVNKKIEKEYSEKIENLKEKIKTKKQNNEQIKNKKSNLPTITIILSILVSIILYITISNLQIVLPIITALILINIFFILKNKKYINIENQKEIRIKNELSQIEKEIEINEENIKKQRTEINKLQEKLNITNSLEKERIKTKYNIEINNEEFSKIAVKIEDLQEQYQNLNLKIKTLELEEKDILPRLDKLAGIEEELEELKEEEQTLELRKECIELAKEIMLESYEKMRNEVSPKFSNNISKLMDIITNGKYKNIKLNDEKGFLVETENGDYIQAEQLSAGTIDQLYLSLRLSSIDTLTKEKLPILLDETFAYFDEERLENILKHLDSEYPDRQIIIFTCTKREEEALNKLNISYNLVEITK